MLSLRKLFTRLMLTGGAVALCSVTAFADDASFVPYQASVNVDSAVLYEDADTDSDEVVTLSQGDTLVILSNEKEGLQPAAWEDGDEVYNGYIDVTALSAEPLGSASVIRDSAVLMDGADASSSVKTELEKDDEIDILGYNDSWYFVQVGDETGFLSVAELDANVSTTSRLNLRSEPNTDSEILDVLPRNTELSPEQSDGEWIKVTFDGQTGYVSSDYVDATEEHSVADPTRSKGEDVVAFAEQYLGNRYVWGGTSLTNGCDCSGFVMKVYQNFGVSLPHSSASIRSYGTKVSYSDAQPGDVVCYSGHVGIYVGNGQIINALNSRVGIVYSDINVMPVVTIRRML